MAENNVVESDEGEQNSEIVGLKTKQWARNWEHLQSWVIIIIESKCI